MKRVSALHLAEVLTAAATVEEVRDAIEQLLPELLDAVSAKLGIADSSLQELQFRPVNGHHDRRGVAGGVVRLDADLPVAEAVRTGKMVAVPSRPVRGEATTVFMPLADSEGMAVAALVVGWADGGSLDEPTLQSLQTTAGLCEQALGRASATDRAAQQAQGLAALAEHLAGAVTTARALEVVATEAHRPVEASVAVIGVIDPATGDLRVHRSDGTNSDHQGPTRRSSEAPLVLSEAARTNRAVFIEDDEAYRLHYSDAADRTSDATGARAAIPVRTAAGEVIGAIEHTWAGPRPFDGQLRSTLTTIADMAGQAIERTRLTDSEHRLVTALQDSVLVSMPAVPGLDSSARYRPAAHDIRMGGDWYQGIVCDESSYALVVGDVAGHGIEAVGDMAQLRAAFDALVRVGTSLDQVLERVTDLLLSNRRTVIATALVAVVDLRSSAITYVSAGHPPPLLRTPAGEVVVLDEGRQLLLGVRADNGRPVELGTAAFPVGSTLVSYTDGLIERRHEIFDESLARLTDHLRSGPLDSAEMLADHILSACLDGHEPDDDIALVVITRNQG